MKIVILGRDGVINQGSDAHITSADLYQPLPGSIEAIARLCQKGFTVVIATNQPGLSEGHFDLDELEAIHAKLTALVEDAGGSIAAIFYCPHGPEDRCNCRSPRTGLIDAIEAEFDIGAQGIPMVFDALVDLQAGIEKGCDPIQISSGRKEETLVNVSGKSSAEPLQVFDNLEQAASYIIETYQ